MIREQAIAILEFKLGRGEEADYFGLNNTGVSSWIGDLSEEREALEMAISSLSAEGEYIKKEDLIKKLNAWDCKAHGIPNYAWRVINDLPTYSFPDRENDYMKAVRRDCGLYE